VLIRLIDAAAHSLLRGSSRLYELGKVVNFTLTYKWGITLFCWWDGLKRRRGWR
jgi:hypothetical protein